MEQEPLQQAEDWAVETFGAAELGEMQSSLFYTENRRGLFQIRKRFR